ncbi:MAG: redoxin family protein [Bryobacter sp.]|jgi:thiol-disulfide isomerase/thioredoxin|nr:redoxin family protein [Bryobacter sp. CoA8 C33]
MRTRRTVLAAISAATLLPGADPMTVRDLAGKAVTIMPGKDVTVVTFISTQCPISNDYNDRMISLHNKFTGKGVKFFFVNANSTEPLAVVAEHAKAVGFPFPVYKDENAADKLNAQVTPESFVFDKTGELLYHGYVDDARNAARVQNHGLRDAIEAALAGKGVSQANTKAFGCTIKRARRS